ncbi:MAG: ribonuclease R, partial [Bacteroidia bacterium]
MAKKKRSTGENNGAKSKRSIKSSLLNYLQTNPNEGLNYKQIAAQLGLNSHAEHDILLAAIEELIADGYLEEKDRGKYKPVLESQYVEGKVDMTKTGAAFIVVEGLEDDIHVQPAKTKNALHGDKVKVLLYARRKGKRPEGEVVEILERKKMEFTGILQVHEKFAFLIADNKKMSIDIFIPISKLNGGVNGEKALVKIIDWPEGAKSPIGRVDRVVGKPGEHD